MRISLQPLTLLACLIVLGILLHAWVFNPNSVDHTTDPATEEGALTSQEAGPVFREKTASAPGRSRRPHRKIARKDGISKHAGGDATGETGSAHLDASIEEATPVSPGAVLTGRVVHGADGEPAVDVSVVALSGGRSRQHRETKTDVFGEFRFSGLPSGTYTVGGRRDEDFEPLIVQPVNGVWVKDRGSNHLELEAYPPVRIAGTVRSGTGFPMASAKVTFNNVTEPRGALPLERDLGTCAQTVTDADGRYGIDGILHGRLWYRVEKEGYGCGLVSYVEQTLELREGYEREKTVVASPGENIPDLDITLYPCGQEPRVGGVTIRGIVLHPNGDPGPHVEVSTYLVRGSPNGCHTFEKETSARTDSSGRFVLWTRAEKVQGMVVLPTEKQPYYGWHQGTPSEQEEVVITLVPCGGFVGIAGDETGTPVEGIYVFLQWRDSCEKYGGEFKTSAISDERGIFEFDLLPPGDYTMNADARGYRPLSARLERHLPAGQTIDDLVMVLSKNPSFRGRLVDQFGSPLGGWKVQGEVTGPDGTFSYTSGGPGGSLDFLSEGSRNRESGARGDRRTKFRTGTPDISVRRPDDQQDFVLRLGGKVTGRVVDADAGRPASGITVGLYSQSPKHYQPDVFPHCRLSGFSFKCFNYTKSDGSFEIEEVPVGRFRIAFHGEPIAPKFLEGITVDESLRTDLGTIQVSRGQTITGNLINGSSGEPIYVAEYEVQFLPYRRSDLDSPVYVTYAQGPDHRGRFRIMGLPDDLRSISFAARKIPQRPTGDLFPGVGPFEIFGEVEDLRLDDDGETDVGDIYLLSESRVDSAGNEKQ